MTVRPVVRGGRLTYTSTPPELIDFDQDPVPYLGAPAWVRGGLRAEARIAANSTAAQFLRATVDYTEAVQRTRQQR